MALNFCGIFNLSMSPKTRVVIHTYRSFVSQMAVRSSDLYVTSRNDMSS